MARISLFYGKITEFDKANEDWVSYVERMTFFLFFEAKGIGEQLEKSYCAIECWGTDEQAIEKFIRAKQTVR